MDLKAALRDIGLNSRETSVYLATLELGESTVLPIAKKAGIKRTYCYDILADLLQKGLVMFVERNNRRRYSAADPDSIKTLLERRLQNFTVILPELKSLYSEGATKPKVRFFEGTDELISIYDQLAHTKEYAAIASAQSMEEAVGAAYFRDQAIRIVRNKVRARELLTQGKTPAGYTPTFQLPLQEIRYLPAGLELSTDLVIFDNKLVLISFTKAVVQTVVIEGLGIVETHKKLFELLWQSAAQSANVR